MVGIIYVCVYYVYMYREAAVPVPLPTLSRYLTPGALTGIGIRGGYNSSAYNVDPVTGGALASGLADQSALDFSCSTVEECIRLSLSKTPHTHSP